MGIFYTTHPLNWIKNSLRWWKNYTTGGGKFTPQKILNKPKITTFINQKEKIIKQDNKIYCEFQHEDL